MPVGAALRVGHIATLRRLLRRLCGALLNPAPIALGLRPLLPRLLLPLVPHVLVIALLLVRALLLPLAALARLCLAVGAFWSLPAWPASACPQQQDQVSLPPAALSVDTHNMCAQHRLLPGDKHAHACRHWQ